MILLSSVASRGPWNLNVYIYVSQISHIIADHRLIIDHVGSFLVKSYNADVKLPTALVSGYKTGCHVDEGTSSQQLGCFVQQNLSPGPEFFQVSPYPFTLAPSFQTLPSPAEVDGDPHHLHRRISQLNAPLHDKRGNITHATSRTLARNWPSVCEPGAVVADLTSSSHKPSRMHRGMGIPTPDGCTCWAC